MAERSAIAWTRSTFNPWIGCTKVGPGCDHCYAEHQDSRKRWGGVTHWGASVARHHTSISNWNQPAKWEKAAAASGEFWPVFCASLADVFDNEVPAEWRGDLFRTIVQTPHLTWQLVTKRIGNVIDMVPPVWRDGFPPNVWIVATIVNERELVRDGWKLMEIPAVVRGVSYEPAIEEVDWGEYVGAVWSPALRRHKPIDVRLFGKKTRALDWIIVGGESTQGAPARPFRVSWAFKTLNQCRAAGVAVFMKQMGSFVLDRNDAGFDGCERRSWPLRPDGCDPDVDFEPHLYVEGYQGADCRIRLMDRAGANPAEWPESLRVRQFPQGKHLVSPSVLGSER